MAGKSSSGSNMKVGKCWAESAISGQLVRHRDLTFIRDAAPLRALVENDITLFDWRTHQHANTLAPHIVLVYKPVVVPKSFSYLQFPQAHEKARSLTLLLFGSLGQHASLTDSLSQSIDTLEKPPSYQYTIPLRLPFQITLPQHNHNSILKDL